MITWTPEFETGHPEIDREHQDICDRLNKIELALKAGAGREQIAEMVGVLQYYTLIHFTREEGAMACVACPRRRENCAAHSRFAERLERWLEVLTIPGLSVSVLEDVHAECVRWIQAHMLHIDTALRGFHVPPRN